MDTSDQEQRAYDRIMLELTSRTQIMAVHGTIIFLIGLLMAITGAPAPVEQGWGPTSRILLGGAAMIIGLVVLLGAAKTDNERGGWLALVLGFGSAMLWHLGLAATYAVAAFQSKMAILAPGEVLSASITNRAYIPLVYIGYFLLTGIQFRTVFKLGPPPR